MELVRRRERSLPQGLRAVLPWLPTVLICLLVLPAVVREPARLTSDESLYAAEALNIATGRGLTYPTGEPIIHRAPFYPAMLAAVYKTAGPSLDHGYWLPRAATLVNALLLMLLARALFGPAAGLVAGALAAASSYLNGLGTTLFLDSVQLSFVLAALLLLWRAHQGGHFRGYLAAGACLGAAVLVKESALLFVPLPLALILAAGRLRGWKAGLAAWSAGVAIVALPWWGWVLWHTGEVYQLGRLDSATTQAAVSAGALAVIVTTVLVWRQPRFVNPRPTAGTQALALAFAAIWGAVFLAGLEWRASEYPRDYLREVPAYAASVFAPAVRPWVLVALCWALVAGRALRGYAAPALPLVAAALFLPFFVFVANRGLALRDVLPLVYLSYVAVAGGAAWLLAWGERLGREHAYAWPRIAGTAVVATVAAIVVLGSIWSAERSAARTPDADWDNELAAGVASWLEANATPGTAVVSTRLYYSHVYFETGGAYAVHQLPTVLTTVHPAAAEPLRREAALFRWESHLLRPSPAGDRWLYLTYYEAKGYYIGLTEADLLAMLVERGAGYVVLSHTDAGFSSPSLVAYFGGSPAFERVYERSLGERHGVIIYRVQPERLELRDEPLRLTRAAHARLLARFGGDEAALAAMLARANAAGYVVTPE